MDNLIGSPSFVIVKKNGFVDPTIYLTEPQENEEQSVYGFTDPFTAKHFIRLNMGESVEITVKKAA